MDIEDLQPRLDAAKAAWHNALDFKDDVRIGIRQGDLGDATQTAEEARSQYMAVVEEVRTAAYSQTTDEGREQFFCIMAEIDLELG